MKYLSIIKYILLIVSAILVVVGAATFVEGEESVTLNMMLIWALVMVLLTIALVIIMPLFAVFQNPKSATRSLIGLGVLVVVPAIPEFRRVRQEDYHKF